MLASGVTAAYRDTRADPRRIGTELGAGFVVEGSIAREADRVRVTAQLIDAGSGRSIWSERWDRRVGRLLRRAGGDRRDDRQPARRRGRAGGAGRPDQGASQAAGRSRRVRALPARHRADGSDHAAGHGGGGGAAGAGGGARPRLRARLGRAAPRLPPAGERLRRRAGEEPRAGGRRRGAGAGARSRRPGGASRHRDGVSGIVATSRGRRRSSTPRWRWRRTPSTC